MKLISMILLLLLICVHPRPSAAQPTQQAKEVRRGMNMADAPAERFSKWFDRLAAQIEPTLQGDPARLGVYLQFFEREIVREPRLFAFKATAVRADGKTRVVGVAEYTEQVETLHRLLSTLKLDPIESTILIAPTERTNGVHFGVARRDAFLYATPEDTSEKVNEALAGEPVWVLDASAGAMRYLVHSTDGYVGWIEADAVEPRSAEQLTAKVNDTAPRHGQLIEVALADAISRIGKPYVWGGRGDEGVDCSGLVQQAFAAAGIKLPRDAEQQAIVGKLVAMRHHRSALRRGDVLFFLGRRGFVAHTGIYLGDGQFIESADGGVRISEFNNDDTRNRREDSFCFAKRILD